MIRVVSDPYGFLIHRNTGLLPFLGRDGKWHNLHFYASWPIPSDMSKDDKNKLIQIHRKSWKRRFWRTREEAEEFLVEWIKTHPEEFAESVAERILKENV